MKNDIIEVMEACVDGTLDQIDLQFEDNAAVCVVLASDGYPVSYEKGFVISGLENFDGKVIIASMPERSLRTRESSQTVVVFWE